MGNKSPKRKDSRPFDWSDGLSYVTRSHVGEDPKVSLRRIGTVSKVPLDKQDEPYAVVVKRVFDEAFRRKRI